MLCATTVSGDSSGAIQRSDSALLCAICLLPLPEEQEPDQRQPEGPGRQDQPVLWGGNPAIHERFSVDGEHVVDRVHLDELPEHGDRKSTRLNSSHVAISYAVVCLKKKPRRP